jgi:osmotically-inducible protein OsmY
MREPMKKITTILLLPTVLLLSSCATVLVGGAIVSGISVANDRRSAGQVMDDKIISAQVRKDIFNSLDNDEHVKVMTYNGVVLLVGEVLSHSDKVKAEDSAATKNGVIRVINELQETNLTSFKRRSKDSYITTKAKSALVRVKLEGFNPTRVRIMTTRGTVYLMGKVSQQESEAVVEKIRNLRGVKKVVKVFEYI